MLQLKGYQQRSLEILRDYFRLVQSEGGKLAFMHITERPFHSVAQLPGLAYVCLRIPTGGGKTFMACHAVEIAIHELLRQDRGVVLWLVPTNAIKDQTLGALRDPRHPYRQALDTSLGYRVVVMDLLEALSVQRATLDSETTIIVSTLAALRVEDTDGRKVYEQNGALMSHFDNLPSSVAATLEKYPDSDKPIPSLANALKSRRPVVIVDEAHNARTDLSFDTLARLNPSCILEFTATPDQERNPSNVLYHVSAYELKAEHMIKLPIRLQLDAEWREALTAAIAQRADLEKLANSERIRTGEYLRPIVLVQAQPRRQNTETLNVDVVKNCLKDLGVPEEQIAIETGDARQVKEWEDEHKRSLFDETCPIRFIITVDKLREGWDCPFAYVLCSVREQAGTTAVEQILGRVLRMPRAMRKEHEDLNYAYAFITSSKFRQTAEGLADALIANGFSRFEATSEIEPKQGQIFPDLPMFTKDQSRLAPAERGEKIEVPQLALRIDGELEPIEETDFLGTWDLSKCDPALNEQDFPSRHKATEDVALDVNEQGDVRIKPMEQRFVSDLQAQLTLLLPKESTTIAELVGWLDRNVPRRDWMQTQEQRQIYLLRLVEYLMNQRGITLDQLSRERFRLRDAATRKMDEQRAMAIRDAYQQILFGQPPTQVEVSPKRVFSFPLNQYPVNSVYEGTYGFQKHFYRPIGMMNDEEARCAYELDKQPSVKYWIRNIERNDKFSFWLPTPTDKFYPDFVALLTDGRVLVVEYKGGHLLTTTDTKEKKAIGDLWALRSKGRCIFALVSEHHIDAQIRSAVGEEVTR